MSVSWAAAMAYGSHQTRISLHAIDAAYDRGRRNKRSMCRDVRPGGRSMRWISVFEITPSGIILK